MIRPQALIAPRPNIRRHPLDRHELEMIDDPPIPNGTNWTAVIVSVLALLVLTVVMLVSLVGVWEVVMWVLQ